MDRSLAKILMFLSIIVLAFAAGAFAIAQNKIACIISFVVWAICYVVLSYFARCPHCGRWPGRHDLFAHYCPRCGEPLD